MIKLDEQLPPKDGRYFVACKGGRVMESYYYADREVAMSYFTPKGSSAYSRKYQGKNSGHFEVAHQYGYEIEYWMEMPQHPDYPHKS